MTPKSPTSALTQFARGVLESFDTTAAVDVALLAALIYLALIGLQRVRTGHALRGALVLGAIYLIARQFNLALTSAALEAFLLLLLVALVMIYREELRQLVERVSRLARPRRGASQSELGVASLVANVAFDLASQKCGALIVLAGDDDLEPLLTGGVALGGEPSSQLIESIFDDSSAGHDGALVIANGMVTRFAAHLPLSKNTAEIGRLGTRHAAGLGLSEHSDAFIIVVSEERGTVSVAVRGTLRVVDEAHTLTEEIREHLGTTKRELPSRWWALLNQHHGLKAAAVAIAVLAWLVLIYGGEPMQRSLATRVRWHEPGGELHVTAVDPEQVRVIVTGSRRDMALASRSPTRVLVAIPTSKPGTQTVRIAPEDVALPKGLSLKNVVPPEVNVTLSEAQSPPAAASSAGAAPSR
jgi:uncharacterized protein (TIGR00159 family)